MKNETPDGHQLAENVREACLAAALEAYEHAKLSGLCDEGAWEAAIGAMRMVDVDSIVGSGWNGPSNSGDS